MDLSTTVLFAVVILIALNQALMRLPIMRSQRWFFWLTQFVNLGVAAAVIVLGLPGFEHVPPVRVVIGLLLVMHLAQNLRLRMRWDREAREAEEEQRRERAAALRGALESEAES